MQIIWTLHARERQKEWEQKRAITSQEIERILLDPEQVVRGDLEVIVAQSRMGDGLLRVPFVETPMGVKMLTVYWTSKVDKYWR
jgi:hypothetical protein